jgi:hypothetical protein
MRMENKYYRITVPFASSFHKLSLEEYKNFKRLLRKHIVNNSIITIYYIDNYHELNIEDVKIKEISNNKFQDSYDDIDLYDDITGYLKEIKIKKRTL